MSVIASHREGTFCSADGLMTRHGTGGGSCPEALARPDINIPPLLNPVTAGQRYGEFPFNYRFLSRQSSGS